MTYLYSKVCRLFIFRHRDDLTETFLLDLFLPEPKVEKSSDHKDQESADHQALEKVLLWFAEQHELVPQEVAGTCIHQAFGDQSGHGSCQVLSRRDPAEWKAEVEDVGGDDVDAPGHGHGPRTVFPDPLIDLPDHFFLTISGSEGCGEDLFYHDVGDHDRHQVDDPCQSDCRQEGEQETECDAEVEDRESACCAEDREPGDHEDNDDRIFMGVLQEVQNKSLYVHLCGDIKKAT